jgi:hypothetical protein
MHKKADADTDMAADKRAFLGALVGAGVGGTTGAFIASKKNLTGLKRVLTILGGATAGGVGAAALTSSGRRTLAETTAKIPGLNRASQVIMPAGNYRDAVRPAGTVLVGNDMKIPVQAEGLPAGAYITRRHALGTALNDQAKANKLLATSEMYRKNNPQLFRFMRETSPDKRIPVQQSSLTSAMSGPAAHVQEGGGLLSNLIRGQGVILDPSAPGARLSDTIYHEVLHDTNKVGVEDLRSTVSPAVSMALREAYRRSDIVPPPTDPALYNQTVDNYWENMGQREYATVLGELRVALENLGVDTTSQAEMQKALESPAPLLQHKMPDRARALIEHIDRTPNSVLSEILSILPGIARNTTGKNESPYMRKNANEEQAVTAENNLQYLILRMHKVAWGEEEALNEQTTAAGYQPTSNGALPNANVQTSIGELPMQQAQAVRQPLPAQPTSQTTAVPNTVKSAVPAKPAATKSAVGQNKPSGLKKQGSDSYALREFLRTKVQEGVVCANVQKTFGR